MRSAAGGSLCLPLALTVLALVSPGRVEAQRGHPSVGGGLADPAGGLADRVDRGWTVRGQWTMALGTGLQLHLQGGYTRFPARDTAGEDDVDVRHAALGGRLGMGLFWVGAAAGWFVGDGEDGLGWLPEAGVGIGPVEVVVDGRPDGDTRWFALRAGLRF